MGGGSADARRGSGTGRNQRAPRAWARICAGSSPRSEGSNSTDPAHRLAIKIQLCASPDSRRRSPRVRCERSGRAFSTDMSRSWASRASAKLSQAQRSAMTRSGGHRKLQPARALSVRGVSVQRPAERRLHLGCYRTGGSVQNVRIAQCARARRGGQADCHVRAGDRWVRWEVAGRPECAGIVSGE